MRVRRAAPPASLRFTLATAATSARENSRAARSDGRVRERQRDAQRASESVGWQNRRQRASVGKISAKCWSFSAVSAPIFARKYAFCSIFQNLPDYQAEILKFGKFLQILRHLQKMLLNFHENC